MKSGKLPFTGLSAQDYNAMGFPTGPKNCNRVIFDANPNYKNTYTGQVSFGITRQLVRDLSLDVAYQMYRGVHIQLDYKINYRPDGLDAATVLRLPANEFGLLGPHFARMDPTIAQFNQYSSIGNSIYHGMTVSLAKRYSAYSQFQVNYTFSKTIDDVTDYNSGFAGSFLRICGWSAPYRLSIYGTISLLTGCFEVHFRRGRDTTFCRVLSPT